MPGKFGNQNARRHGHSGDGYDRSLTYNTWRTMKERCYRTTHKWWYAYGGVGITVCDRWLGKTGFACFLEDMGPRPDKSMTLDRIRGKEGYSKENCKWATKSEQRRNQRTPAQARRDRSCHQAACARAADPSASASSAP